MTNTSKGSGKSSQEPGNGLAERVQARVAEVGLTLARRRHGSRPRAKDSRAPRHTAATPEARSLRRVYNELAVTHREYRLRSGQRASPALREAAKAFKAGPSLPNLVAVASFLEEDGLIAW